MRISEKYKVFVFDFDGTLVDSMPTFGSVMLSILDDTNTKYPEDVLKIITPLGYIGTTDYFLRLGVPLERERILELMGERMIDAYKHRIGAKDGVAEALARLKEEGCSLHVLTASPHETLDPCLERIGLCPMFDNVWSCNDFNTTKADPNIYTAVAERIGCKAEEMVFIDDNIDAISTAKKANCFCMGIYDKSSEEYTEQMKSIADGYIVRMEELLSFEV